MLGSGLATNVEPYGDAGWASMYLDGVADAHALPGGHGDGGYVGTLHGLPVTGFMVYNIINTNAAPGRLANYGGVFPHRTTMRCWSDGQFTGPGPCP